MAGEYDEKFTEITGILQEMQKSVRQIDGLQGGLDEMRLEMRDMRKELRENVNETKSVSRKVDILTGQFTSVVGEFIEDHKRIDTVEKRVAQLENPVH